MTESEEEKKKAEKEYEEYRNNKREKERLYAKMYYWQNRYYNFVGLKKPKKEKERKEIIIDKEKLTYNKKGPFIIVFE